MGLVQKVFCDGCSEEIENMISYELEDYVGVNDIDLTFEDPCDYDSKRFFCCKECLKKYVDQL